LLALINAPVSRHEVLNTKQHVDCIELDVSCIYQGQYSTRCEVHVVG